MNILMPSKTYDKTALNSAMEDCMEIIYGNYKDEGYIRANVLTFKLGTTPSRASKIVSNLKAKELVEFEKNGVIKPTENGIEFGEYLQKRREILKEFFTVINGTDEITEEIDRIGHFLSKQTVENIEVATDILRTDKE